MSENKYPCGLIRDLIPLYRDGVCGEESKHIVEEHLQTCGECREVCEQLENSLSEQLQAEQALMREAGGVLRKHEEKERHKATIAGAVTAGILIIPVLICLICNLAVGHALDWFFIVLTAMLTTASITVVPMLTSERKLCKTILCFTGSLLLMLLTICLYADGDWFFVAAVPIIFGLSVIFLPFMIRSIPLPKTLSQRRALMVILWDMVWLILLLMTCCIYTGGDWFFVATVPIIFGLSVIFLPFLIKSIPLPKPLSSHKGLVVMLWDTAWLFAIMPVCIASEEYLHLALLITAWFSLLPWIIFVCARYLPLHYVTKAGIITAVTGTFLATACDVVLRITEYFGIECYAPTLFEADLRFWDCEHHDANIELIILLSALVVGLALIVVGIVLKRRKK